MKHKASKFKLTWRGDDLYEQRANQISAAMQEFSLQLETAAKQELYPGHGVRTGTLRRSITAIPIRREGTKIRGGVGAGAESRRYSKVIHARYRYITNPFERIRPKFRSILRKHTGAR